MKRRAIAYNIMILLGMFIIVGVVWIGIYYGAIQPIQNSVTGTFGAGTYDTTTLTFVDTMATFWLFIITIGGLYYLWQQSQKRRSYYE